MPIYEFRCKSCGNRFELFLPMNSSKNQECPVCGETAVRVLSPTAGFVVNSSSGSGFQRREACDRSRPCCGRDEPCEHRPCED